MPTAIVRAHTPDGFIIAADGRVVNNDTLEIRTDERQKIFQVGANSIAYCLTGATLLGDHSDNLEIVLFNFHEHLDRRTRGIPKDSFDSMEECARLVCWPIYEDLRYACRHGEVDLPMDLGGNPGNTILSVFFDGYLRDGSAGMVTVRFYHEDSVPREPQITPDQLGVARYGSEIVFNEMLSGNKFDRFKISPPSGSLQRSENMNREMGAALHYIRACSSDEARAMDPSKCKTIGGRVHIARITPKVGFRWIPGFAPVISSPSASPQPSRSGTAFED